MLKKKFSSFLYLLWIRIFSFFPIDDKKIVFDNFNGKGYAGNTKYIAEELLKRNINYKLYWILEKTQNAGSVPKEIVILKKRSFMAAYHQETAKVWVDNVRKANAIKRKGQYYVQAWHGLMPIKLIEEQAENKLSTKYIKFAKNDSSISDLILAPCRSCQKIMEQFFWLKDKSKIKLFGAPEYDLLINENIQIKNSIKQNLGIQKQKILLYAPTFRISEEYDYFNVNFKEILKSLERKFGGDWILAIRLHPNVKTYNINKIECDFIDVTKYDDSQELCLIADALITDYSSIIFGSAILNKPSFILAMDISDYKNERGLEISKEELPFSVSENLSELLQNIETYNPVVENKKIDNFFSKIGMIYTGNASKQCVDWILQKIKL